MIFRTFKCLIMLSRALKVKYQHYTVNVITSYRYLGVDIDPSLKFNNYFMTSHKKTTGRLYLLNKLWFQLDTKAAVTIYKSLIIPVLTYCSVFSIFDDKSRASLKIHVPLEFSTDILIKPTQFYYHISLWLKRNMLACLRVNVLMENYEKALENILVSWALKNTLEITQSA